MKKNASFSVNSLQLKIIGFVLTLVGAVGITFFSGEGQEMTRLILEFISYPAVAIFAFLLAEGCRKTRDLKRYAIGLVMAAVAAEPFYDYACLGIWLDFGSANGQNFLFALLLCMLVMVFLQTALASEKWKWLMVGSLVLAVPFWAVITNVRFCGLAMLLTIVFGLLREKPKARLYVTLAVGTVLKVTAGLSALLLQFYNGERGNYPKYLFYALYPAMWAVLAMIKLLTV